MRLISVNKLPCIANLLTLFAGYTRPMKTDGVEAGALGIGSCWEGTTVFVVEGDPYEQLRQLEQSPGGYLPASGLTVHYCSAC